MPDALEIVPSRLLDTFMGIDRRVPGCSREVFTILVGDVASVTVFVAFGQAKVNYVNFVAIRFSSADQEVIRFNISMNDPIFMNCFYKSYELNGDLNDSL